MMKRGWPTALGLLRQAPIWFKLLKAEKKSVRLSEDLLRPAFLFAVILDLHLSQSTRSAVFVQGKRATAVKKNSNVKP